MVVGIANWIGYQKPCGQVAVNVRRAGLELEDGGQGQVGVYARYEDGCRDGTWVRERVKGGRMTQANAVLGLDNKEAGRVGQRRWLHCHVYLGSAGRMQPSP